MNSHLHALVERRPHRDASEHEASVELARALGGIGAWPECPEHGERLRSALDSLKIGPC
jgi:hypothetical protein